MTDAQVWFGNGIRQAIAEVNKRECACIPCSECGGTGTVWFRFGGREYLGHNRADDLDEPESCDYCRGGILQTCDRCGEMDELYEQLGGMR